MSNLHFEHLSLERWKQSSIAHRFFDPAHRSGLWLDYIEQHYSPIDRVVMIEVSQDQQVICHLLVLHTQIIETEIFQLKNIFMPNQGFLTATQATELFDSLPKHKVLQVNEPALHKEYGHPYLVRDIKTTNWYHPFLMGKDMHVLNYASNEYACLRFSKNVPLLELPENLTVSGSLVIEASENVTEVPAGLKAQELRLFSAPKIGDNLEVNELSISNTCGSPSFGLNCTATTVYLKNIRGQLELSGLTILYSITIFRSFCSSISHIKARRLVLDYNQEQECTIHHLQIEEALTISNSLFAEVGPSVSCQDFILRNCARTGLLNQVSVQGDLIFIQCGRISLFAPNLVIGNDLVVKDRVPNELVLPDYGLIYGNIVVPDLFSVYLPKTFSCLGQIKVVPEL